MPFAEIIATLNSHYTPQKNAIVERYRFNTCNRKTGQSVTNYIAELKELARFCDFGVTAEVVNLTPQLVLEENLRDRFVCGLGESRTQRRLLSETKLTYKSAVDIANAMELADEGASHLSGGKATSQVNQLFNKQCNSGKKKKSTQPNSTTKSKKPCYRCTGDHKHEQCPFRDAECYNCKKKGHIAKACKATGDKNNPGAKPEQKKACTVYELYNMNTKSSHPPITVNISIDETEVNMEVDTGASATLITKSTMEKVWPVKKPTLCTENNLLRTYTGEIVPICGTTVMNLQYRDSRAALTVMVVDSDGPNILGRDGITALKLQWSNIHQLQELVTLDTVLDKHSAVFGDDLGAIDGVQASFNIDPSVQPRFLKARPVPYAIRDKVEAELCRLEKEGILEKIEQSDWAAPIVPVVKSNGNIRICGDFRTTVNLATKTENYPIPKIEDIYSTLSGGSVFSKLDCSNAYLQYPLHPESRKYTTINTSLGLMRYTRLPFGVSSAPAIYQRVMDSMLREVPGVCVYLDDILISGANDKEHLERLNSVLEVLSSRGLRLSKEKCSFSQSSVQYLGHVIDKNGLHPLADKIKAISAAPPPKNVTEVKSFLGMLQFYSRFLKNLATVIEPLTRLLRKNCVFHWGASQEQAFDCAKKMLQGHSVLVHFDTTKELVLSCDASPYGVGAVLSHIMDDGSERPIAYYSRSMAPAERNYSQLDKEALAIICGVKRFYQYIYGRKFTIMTDHKPLLGIFGQTKAIPQMSSSRMQRWCLTLSTYDYVLKFRARKSNGNADALSRLPLNDIPTDVPLPEDVVCVLNHMNGTTATVTDIRKYTRQDPTLSSVLQFVKRSWPDNCENELKPYYNRRSELSVQEDCVLWGNCVIVPPALRKNILMELHDCHPGVVRMKSLARSYLWWPLLDMDIESVVKECAKCQHKQKAPAAAPLHPWEWPKEPWSRLHVDYAGPIHDKMLLIIVDAHSKWIDVHVTSSSTAATTIEKLMLSFSTHGLPNTIVSDNGPCFTAHEFKQFVKTNGVRHITTSPWHPASNGLAERAVQTVKNGIRCMEGGDIQSKVTRYLAKYRITPQSTTGVSPAQLLMKRQVRTRLDLINPNLSSRVLDAQSNQKTHHDYHAKDRTLSVGDPVLCDNFGKGDKLLPGHILHKPGPMSYFVKLDDGRYIRRHQDNVRFRSYAVEPTESHESGKELFNENTVLPNVTVATSDKESDTIPPLPEKPPINTPLGTSPVRRSTRVSKPPDRLDL